MTASEGGLSCCTRGGVDEGEGGCEDFEEEERERVDEGCLECRAIWWLRGIARVADGVTRAVETFGWSVTEKFRREWEERGGGGISDEDWSVGSDACKRECVFGVEGEIVRRETQQHHRLHRDGKSAGE